MSLPLDPKFGFGDMIPIQMTRRDAMLVCGALRNMTDYHERLALRAKDEEAIGRNKVNALESRDLSDRIKAQANL